MAHFHILPMTYKIIMEQLFNTGGETGGETLLFFTLKGGYCFSELTFPYLSSTKYRLLYR